jgi:hypothetical protein
LITVRRGKQFPPFSVASMAEKVHHRVAECRCGGPIARMAKIP